MNETKNYPWSFQMDLFEYLTPEQQMAVRPILRVLKKPAQVELCCALLDYLEQGIILPPDNLLLWAAFNTLTNTGAVTRDASNDPSVIRPLCIRSTVPQSEPADEASENTNEQHD